MMRRAGFFTAVLLGLQAAWALLLPPAFGADTGSCVSKASSCSAPAPSCEQPQTSGTDNCGAGCYSKPYDRGTCSATCDKTTGTWSKCPSSTCSQIMGTCTPDSTIPCGQTGPGHYANCQTVACTVPATACPTSFAPYGFAIPGDPVYGFPNVKSNGQPVIPNPGTKTFLGLVAKGNVVIGDYTSQAFKDRVLPYLRPHSDDNQASKVQPYVVDPTDEVLGYNNSSNCVGGKTPCFNGNYDQQDKDGLNPGQKLDAGGNPVGPRKFYESTLDDAVFRGTLNMPLTTPTTIDAVLFTNHALTSLVPKGLAVNGSLVSRDDALVANGTLAVNHDVRLLDGQTAHDAILPLVIKRFRMVSRQDCGAGPCPP